MKKGLTELVFILDCSGSMYPLAADTIGGFNNMLEKQRNGQGQAYVSTVLFNSSSRVVHDRAEVQHVLPMTEADYRPCGNTALLDALGDAIHHIGNVHKYARPEDVPEHTLFVIATDGMENASRRYSADQVRQKITRQKERYGWEFLFLGANIDALETAERYGIDRQRAVQFHSDAQGTQINYKAVSDAVLDVRGRGCVRQEWKADIEADFAHRKNTEI